MKMKKIARALGILLLVAFSFSCSNLFDEKKYNSSTLEKDSGKGSGDSGGSGGNGGSGGSGGNGGSGGSTAIVDSYIEPTTYLSEFTETRFYHVKAVEPTLKSGFCIKNKQNCFFSNGEQSTNKDWTQGSYVTLNKSNETVVSGNIEINQLVINSPEPKEVPVYEAVLHTKQDDGSYTTKTLGKKLVILKIGPKGFLALNCKDDTYTETLDSFMTFFYTQEGWKEDIAYPRIDYNYPTESEIAAEMEAVAEKRYKITMGEIDTTLGTITANQKEAPKDYKLELKVTPSSGYKVRYISIVDKDGKEIKQIIAAQMRDGEYTYTMPDKDITINVVFQSESIVTHYVQITPTPPANIGSKYYDEEIYKGYYALVDDGELLEEPDIPPIVIKYTGSTLSLDTWEIDYWEYGRPDYVTGERKKFDFTKPIRSNYDEQRSDNLRPVWKKTEAKFYKFQTNRSDLQRVESNIEYDINKSYEDEEGNLYLAAGAEVSATITADEGYWISSCYILGENRLDDYIKEFKYDFIMPEESVTIYSYTTKVYGNIPPKAPKQLGDIIFYDGSAVRYSDDLVLTDEQKEKARSVVFYIDESDGKTQTYVSSRIFSYLGGYHNADAAFKKYIKNSTGVIGWRGFVSANANLVKYSKVIPGYETTVKNYTHFINEIDVSEADLKNPGEYEIEQNLLVSFPGYLRTYLTYELNRGNMSRPENGYDDTNFYSNQNDPGNPLYPAYNDLWMLDQSAGIPSLFTLQQFFVNKEIVLKAFAKVLGENKVGLRSDANGYIAAAFPAGNSTYVQGSTEITSSLRILYYEKFNKIRIDRVDTMVAGFVIPCYQDNVPLPKE